MNQKEQKKDKKPEDVPYTTLQEQEILDEVRRGDPNGHVREIERDLERAIRDCM